VLRGLEFLHSRQPHAIAHHDLKQDNVLLFMDDGGAITAKLCDVDCAKFATTRGSLHGAGGGAGMYMAPEVLTGGATVKVDMFSFGVMVAEIVLVYLPNSAGVVEPVDIGRDYGLSGRFRMVEAALSKLDEYPELEAVIEGCVKLEPARRLTATRALKLVQHMSCNDTITKLNVRRGFDAVLSPFACVEVVAIVQSLLRRPESVRKSRRLLRMAVCCARKMLRLLRKTGRCHK
jgi:serine/threonine protein kinase